jgi:ketosteroid isomerase-like protein
MEVMAKLAATWAPRSMGDDATMERQLDLCFDERIVVREPSSLPHGGCHEGMAEYRELQEKMREKWELRMESAEYWPCGDDRVTLRIVFEWTARETGRSIVLPMIDLIRVEDGRIVEVEPFVFDTKALLDTLAEEDAPAAPVDGEFRPSRRAG